MITYDCSQHPSHSNHTPLDGRNVSFYAPTCSSAVCSLLTTYHPALHPKTRESIFQMESAYGPGSVEYELTANYLRNSTKSRAPTLWATDIPKASVNSSKSANQAKTNSPNKQSIIITSPNNTFLPASTTFFPYIVNHQETHYYWGKDIEENNETALVYTEQASISKGAFLFLFGFLIFPLWWIGAVCPRNPKTKSQRRWKIYNRMASVCSLPLLGFVLGPIIR